MLYLMFRCDFDVMKSLDVRVFMGSKHTHARRGKRKRITILMITRPWFCVHSEEKKAAEMLLLIDGTCDLAQIRDPVALHTTAAEQQHSLVVRTLYL